MKQTICDVCGKLVYTSGFSLNIGGFHNKKEINVRMSFYQGGCSGFSRWNDVDLCEKCVKECVELAVTELFEQISKKGKLENNTGIHHNFKETK